MNVYGTSDELQILRECVSMYREHLVDCIEDEYDNRFSACLKRWEDVISERIVRNEVEE